MTSFIINVPQGTQLCPAVCLKGIGDEIKMEIVNY